MLGALDHVGIAVTDLEEALLYYRDILGMALLHRETIEEQGVEAVLLLDVGLSHVELITPLGPDSGVAKFLERRGSGLHHIAYRVGDIDAALVELVVSGVQLIDKEPRVGIRGSRVAFLHPRSTGGVLTEIVQTDVQ